jgi:hypothetical protein
VTARTLQGMARVRSGQVRQARPLSRDMQNAAGPPARCSAAAVLDGKLAGYAVQYKAASAPNTWHGNPAQAVVLRSLAAARVLVLAHPVAAAHEATKPPRRHLDKSTR